MKVSNVFPYRCQSFCLYRSIRNVYSETGLSEFIDTYVLASVLWIAALENSYVFSSECFEDIQMSLVSGVIRTHCFVLSNTVHTAHLVNIVGSRFFPHFSDF